MIVTTKENSKKHTPKRALNKNINRVQGKPASVRIIAGCWRSRRLNTPVVTGLRPTSNRLRETLFNWIQQKIDGSECLDAFSGTGALGFEALSRGAGKVDFLEKNKHICHILQENANLLNCSKAHIIQTDALVFLKQKAVKPYDIVFIDPPFYCTLVQPCCSLLNNNNYLKSGSHIYIEMECTPQTCFTPPTNWQQLQQKKVGQVTTFLFQVK